MKSKYNTSYAIKKIIKVLFILALNLAIIAFASTYHHRDSVDTFSRQGSRGTEVTQIQTRLKSLNYYNGKIDGVYGAKTKASVTAFQRSKGLVADGMAGDKTLRALGVEPAARTSQVQEKLKSLKYYNGKIDGVYGSKTKSAVQSFQRAKKLTADGIIGSKTLSALGITSTNRTHEIQQRLMELGFYSDKIDGVYGLKTTNAIKAFQKRNNLKADGNAGPKTLSALGVATNYSNTGKYSSADISLLARVISAESRGEPYTGQVAVGAVILNRIEHPSFPNTLSDVIYKPGAFTCVTDGQINQPVSDSAKRAAQDAMNGWDPSGGAIYYYNPVKSTNKWIFSRPVITTIGSHRFCS